MRPGGPEPEPAEHPGYGIWPCGNAWHTTRKAWGLPVDSCPDCPNRWWAVDGTGCPEEYALLAEIDWLRSRLDTAREALERDGDWATLGEIATQP